jgi:hypothetical protein
MNIHHIVKRAVLMLFIIHNAAISTTPTTGNPVDFIIFSYDRPMQLYALLESTEKYLTGIASMTVIYRTSSERFENSYQIVKQQFPYVQYIKQGANPRKDFRHLVLQACNAGSSFYLIFAPDDVIVKNYADLDYCIQKMEEYNAYGFFLRLGTHLEHCYAETKPMPVPPLTYVDNNLCQWTFKDGTGDWRYSNNVDMTLYRKKDILWQLEANTYSSPNTMESCWAGYQKNVVNRKSLCFRDSIIVNIPANLIQEDWHNPCMYSWSTLQLLELFESGFKIDINKLDGIKNKSCHMNYELTFIER